jgi:hypothetical protein
VPLEVALLGTEERPLYQQVAQKALQLRELGLSYCGIARKLEVDDKTVAKAIGWLQMMRSSGARVRGADSRRSERGSERRVRYRIDQLTE